MSTVSAIARRIAKVLLGLGPIGLGLAVLVVGLLVSFFLLLDTLRPVAIGRATSLSEVTQHIDAGQAKTATFYDGDARLVVTNTDGSREYASYPKSDTQTAELIKQAGRAGIPYVVDPQSGKAKLRFVVQYLFPLVILAALFGLIFLVTSGEGAAGEFAAFSKLRSGKTNLGDDRMTFDRIAGAGEAVVELGEVVDYLKNPARYADVGARAPKGVLLVGPPGTGKTLLARAVAGEAGVPFFSISGAEFVESLVGVGAARVRDLFKQARANAPAIIFIDEIDAAGRQRGAGMGQGNDEREQTLNQMLVEMDGFSASAGIAVLAATNRPDILDPALLRPGRFDRQVVVDAPDVEGRIAILNLYLDKRPMSGDCSVELIARQCPGMTGAELANLVNEAALVAVRRGSTVIAHHDLEEAVERVVAGPQRRNRVLSDHEKALVALHEAGHAVAAASVGLDTGIQKLSIVPRGRQLGHTTTYQITDRLILTQSDLHRQLVTMMAGLAAEQLVIGQITTGSEGDLHNATTLARVMVANLGMGEAIGRVAVGQKSGEVFLGRDFTKMQEVSPATLEKVDGEIRALLERAEAEATRLLRLNRDVLERLARDLYDAETMSGPKLQELLAHVVPEEEALPEGEHQVDLTDTAARDVFLGAFTRAAPPSQRL